MQDAIINFFAAGSLEKFLGFFEKRKELNVEEFKMALINYEH